MFYDEDQSDDCVKLKQNRKPKHNAPILVIDHPLHVAISAVVDRDQQAEQVAHEYSDAETCVHECSVDWLTLCRHGVVDGAGEGDEVDTRSDAEHETSDHEGSCVFDKLDNVEDDRDYVRTYNDLAASKAWQQRATEVTAQASAEMTEHRNHGHVVQ